jgi:catechol 2,3-dioxygenase-like lactoylglutathione lyase family enzyme
VRAVGPNHVGITAHDLDTSRAFYVEVFGLEPLPSSTSATPVAWLHRDAGTIDRLQVPDLIRLADLEPQTSTGRPSLFLDPGRPAVANGAAATTHRGPAEVFAHHGRALLAEDLDDLVADYAADAVLRRPGAVHRGRDQVRAFFAGLLAELPAARWEAVSTAIDGEVVFHEWTATSARHHVPDGIDTLLVRDGLIRVQTVRYTLLPAR